MHWSESHAARGGDCRQEGCKSGYYDLHRDLNYAIALHTLYPPFRLNIITVAVAVATSGVVAATSVVAAAGVTTILCNLPGRERGAERVRRLRAIHLLLDGLHQIFPCHHAPLSMEETEDAPVGISSDSFPGNSFPSYLPPRRG